MPITRREFLKITALAGIAAGMSLPVTRFLLRQTKLTKVTQTHLLMGTVVNFVLLAEDEVQAKAALQSTLEEMRRLIWMHDYRQAGTPLAELNATGVSLHPPAELVATLRQARDFSEKSQGAFDVTVKPLLDAIRQSPERVKSTRKLVDYRQLLISNESISLGKPEMSVTLDGIAKGRVVDGGLAVLKKWGFSDILLEAGGDLRTIGDQAGKGWRVGIAHPRNPGQMIDQVCIHNQAVATSGDYMHSLSADYSMHHIIDPRTGNSPAELASATVLAPSVSEADALSTTLMVLGVQDGLAMIDQLPGCAALLITKDLQLFRSQRFPTS